MSQDINIKDKNYIKKIIGVGDYSTSSNSDVVLVTHSLGSCVAMCIYDPVKKLGGLNHIALPESEFFKEKAANKPGYFADTGVILLIEEMEKMGGLRKNFIIKLIGGANILDKIKDFEIGKGNVLKIKKILWKMKLGVLAEDVMGMESRTVKFYMDNGRIIINYGNGERSAL